MYVQCLQRSRLFYFYLRSGASILALSYLAREGRVSRLLLRRASRLLFLTAAVSSLPLRSERVRVRVRACVGAISLPSLPFYYIGRNFYNAALLPSSCEDRGVKANGSPRYARAGTRLC